MRGQPRAWRTHAALHRAGTANWPTAAPGSRGSRDSAARNGDLGARKKPVSKGGSDRRTPMGLSGCAQAPTAPGGAARQSPRLCWTAARTPRPWPMHRTLQPCDAPQPLAAPQSASDAAHDAGQRRPRSRCVPRGPFAGGPVHAPWHLAFAVIHNKNGSMVHLSIFSFCKFIHTRSFIQPCSTWAHRRDMRWRGRRGQ